MEQAQKVQMQFNQQAEQFATWEVTGNEVNLQQFSRFCKLGAADRVLDVACGTGNMVNYCAAQVQSVDGVDIAERMIALGQAEAARQQRSNVNFSLAPVEDLPYADGGHTVVMSRAAFHHFAAPRRVLDEMLRCCCVGGNLFIQDIIGYGDPDIDVYVEELELAIDSSHCRTLQKEEFTNLFSQLGLEGIHGVEFQIRLDFVNYVGHATQSKDMLRELDQLVERGLGDAKLSKVLERQDGRLFLVRNVLFLGGRKPAPNVGTTATQAPRIVRLNLTQPGSKVLP